MQTHETPVAEERERPQPIASWRHLAGFLLIGIAVAGFGLWAQMGHANGADSGQLAGHGAAVQIYLTVIFMDWALFYYCWGGVRRRGGSIWQLAGGRWNSWRSVAVDLGIALPFWIATEGAAWGIAKLLGPDQAKAVDSLLPKSLLEVLLWIATCITAGVCEEMVFRGYLQRQFHALGGSAALAIAAQGLVFGIFHCYQGWKNVAGIFLLGILYGTLAVWRRNLRANMMAHAWSDLWEGWLKFLIWR